MSTTSGKTTATGFPIGISQSPDSGVINCPTKVVSVEALDTDSESSELEDIAYAEFKDAASTTTEGTSSFNLSLIDSTSNLKISTVRREKQRYWKVTFTVILLPLIFCGIPVHLLLYGHRGLSGTKQWLRQIFLKDPWPKRTITFLFFLLGLVINGLFIYISGGMLYNLVVNGVVRYNIFEETSILFQMAPIVIPLDIIWISGFRIRNLLKSFDLVTYPEVNANFSDSKTKKSLNKWKNGWIQMPMYRVKLFGIYILLLLNQTIHFLVLSENLKKLNHEVKVLNYWVEFITNFMYNLMLPVYICLCYALEFEVQRLSLYIKSLIFFRIQPTEAYFSEFKKYYKEVSSHIVLTNDICGVYFSWVLFVLYYSMYNEVYGVAELILGAIIGAFLGFTPEPVTPIQVRLFIGNMFGGLTQLSLITLIIWACICTNDEARHIHVRLNDFVTEPYVCLSPELYKKFRMLKHYVHSRMETERPALLTISVFSLLPYCSSAYKWKTAYNVRH